ncbi:Uncharacterized protein TSPI_07613 [Trichinella spiralis]|uniref:Uncharacterized protein n=1 Tax=Trichinella spiralis TaxID=6334 RepID=A0ABR3K3I6_TRISP
MDTRNTLSVESTMPRVGTWRGEERSTWRGEERSTWRGEERSTWRGEERSTWRGEERSTWRGEERGVRGEIRGNQVSGYKRTP